MAAGKRRTRLSRVLLCSAIVPLALMVASRWHAVEWKSGLVGWRFDLRAGGISVLYIHSFGRNGGPPDLRHWVVRQLDPPVGPSLLYTDGRYGEAAAFYSTSNINGFGTVLSGVTVTLFPPTLLILASSVGLSLWARRARLRAARVVVCTQCGYDTAGLSRGVPCPECGLPILE